MGTACPGWPNCSPPQQVVNPPAYHAQAQVTANPNVTVYHVNSPMIVQQVTYEQIQNIGLNCGQKDFIINYLESRVGSVPANPEQLGPDQRRLNSAARTKIWQLRTYCR